VLQFMLVKVRVVPSGVDEFAIGLKLLVVVVVLGLLMFLLAWRLVLLLLMLLSS